MKKAARQKSAGRKGPQVKSRCRFSKLAAAGLIIPLLLAGAAVALFKSPAPSPAPTPAPLQSQSSFAPQNPAKEYIYAGGRLVATEEPVALPAAPSNLRVVRKFGGTKILTWADNSINEDGFHVEQRSFSAGAWTQWTQVGTTGPNAFKYTITGVGCDRSYRVRAYNTAGHTAYSNESGSCWWKSGEGDAQEGLETDLLVENVSWASAVGVQVTGNSLRKASGSASWYDAGAVSSRTITSGSGYVEFTPANSITWRMIGLGNGNTSQYFGDIEYALFMGGDSTLHVYESGVYRGQVGTYAPSDRLRVAVDSGQVSYYRNGVLLYVSPSTATYPLLVDTSLNTLNSEINNAQVAATAFGGVPPPENVVWTSLSANVQATGNTLRKVSGGNLWNAGAISTRAIASGDGYVEFTVDNAVTYRMCGLSNGDGGYYYTDVDFAFYAAGGGSLYIYEGGVAVGQSWTYAPVDKLRVAVEGSVVKYYKNGALLYTSSRTPVYPLLVDTSLNTVNADVYAAVIAGTLTP